MRGEVVDQGTYRQSRAGEFISVLAVVERDSADVVELEHDLASSRGGRRDRRALQRQLEEASAQLAKREAMLPAEARPLVAAEAIQEAWRARRSQRSHRHPHHDESLWELDQLALAVVQDAAQVTIPALRRRRSVTIYDGWGVRVGDLPSVVALIEERRVRQVVTREILGLRALVRDSPLLHRESPDGQAMIIEHAATGLRIKCIVQKIGFAAILARADQVWSIGPTGHDGSGYHGLGVGRLLYREAGRRWPDRRWLDASEDTAATSIRHRLHAEAPYRWEHRGCELCGRSWRDRSAHDFADHLRFELRAEDVHLRAR